MTRYELVEVHTLPSFDPSKTVKHALLSPASVARVDHVIHSYGAVLTVCYFAGTLLFPVLLLGRTEIAAYTAVIEAILEVPSYAVAFLALRTDLLKLLVTSYDYWFFLATTIFFTVSFARLAHDVRVVLIASRWLGFQVPILIDAMLVPGRALVHAVMVNVVLIALALVAIGLNITDGLTTVVIVVSSRHSLLLRDILVNTMLTMEILLLRITFLKYEVTRRPKLLNTDKGTITQALSKMTITCVTIRCAVKLQAMCVSATAKHESGNLRVSLPPPKSGVDSNVVQLKRSASHEVYDSADILAPQLLHHHQHNNFKIVLQTTGYTAATLTLLCSYLSAWSNTSHAVHIIQIVVSASAVVSTVAFVGMYVLFSNRQLLRRLYLSFDFIFLSLQISAAHVSLCDMLYWQLAPCATLACAWLWVHWVITMDALTPLAKEWLGYQQRLQVVVIILYFAGQVAACCGGLMWDRWDVQSRVILRTKVLGHAVEFSVLPFFASRLLTILVWTLRLLWRVCYEPDRDKLLMLRGQVEFELMKTRRAPPPVALTQVVPFEEGQGRSK